MKQSQPALSRCPSTEPDRVPLPRLVRTVRLKQGASLRSSCRWPWKHLAESWTQPWLRPDAPVSIPARVARHLYYRHAVAGIARAPLPLGCRRTAWHESGCGYANELRALGRAVLASPYALAHHAEGKSPSPKRGHLQPLSMPLVRGQPRALSPPPVAPHAPLHPRWQHTLAVQPSGGAACCACSGANDCADVGSSGSARARLDLACASSNGCAVATAAAGSASAPSTYPKPSPQEAERRLGQQQPPRWRRQRAGAPSSTRGRKLEEMPVTGVTSRLGVTSTALPGAALPSTGLYRPPRLP
eukprot:scaffold1006_cov408-Prasinococcus_capsulatus_cf.AAC.4